MREFGPSLLFYKILHHRKRIRMANDTTTRNGNGNGLQYYLEYDLNDPPKKARETDVRFIIISDTHSTQPKIPDGDVLLHSGDLTDIGGTKAFEEQLDWLGNLPHQFKFIIGGNHDFGLDTKKNWYQTKGKQIHSKLGYTHANPNAIQNSINKFESKSKPNGKNVYLEDQKTEFEFGKKTWSVYGSPWSPEFGGWAWNYKRGGEEAKSLYDKFEQCDILLTHTPPHSFGGLDVLTDGKTHVGCEELTERLQTGKLRPLLHCFGHIHEAYGAHLQQWSKEKQIGGYGETLFLNAALVEMNMKILLLEGAIKYPALTVLRWLGYGTPEWLQVGLRYKTKNLYV